VNLQVAIPGVKNIIGGDFFLLGNISAGNCWTRLSSVINSFSLRYGASLGFGIGIQQDFGLAARLSWVDTNRFAVSLDLGSFAEPRLLRN